MKRRIRAAGCIVREPYANRRQLGQWVLSDLLSLVDRLFPQGAQPDVLASEAADHEAFAASRRGVYIGRPHLFARLDAYTVAEEPPLVVDAFAAILAMVLNRATEALPLAEELETMARTQMPSLLPKAEELLGHVRSRLT